MEWNYENVIDLWDYRREDKKEIKKKGRIINILGSISGVIIAFIWVSNQRLSSGLIEIIMITSILIFCFIHVIIHETGHLIGGLLSGYRFISFRIFSFTFVKYKDRYKLKIDKIKGTGGQCIMLPPDNIEFSQCPYYLYNIGGILFDMLITIFVLIIALTLCNHPIISDLLLTYVVLGVHLSIINYIPLPKQISSNDGNNIRAIRHNKSLRQSFLQQLIIYHALLDGKDFHEFTKSELEIPKETDISESLNSFFLSVQYMQCLKTKNFKGAYELLPLLEHEYECMSKRMRLMIDVERLFLLLIHGADIRGVKTHYKNIKKEMNKNKSLPVLRTLYAYERMIHKDDKKAIQLRKRTLIMTHFIPIPQEVQLNIELMDWFDTEFIIQNSMKSNGGS